MKLVVNFRIEDNIPDLGIKRKLPMATADEVPIYCAVVDNGNVTFYSFNFMELSVDLASSNQNAK